MSFAIVTDSLAGLPLAQIAQRGLVVIPLSYTISGKEHLCLAPNGLGPPAGFAAQDNAAVWVSLEQGLEAQRRPQHGLGAGETSAPAEVHQVIHREKVGNPVPEGEEGAGGVLQAHPPLPQVEGPRAMTAPPFFRR